MRELEEKLARIKRNSAGKWISADGKIFIEITSSFIYILKDGEAHDFFNWKFSDRMEFGNFVVMDASESLLRLSCFSGARFNIENTEQFILRRIAVSTEAIAV